MKELWRSGDVVALSWLTAFLADNGIDSEVFDSHTSSLLGPGLGFPLRRLMVADEDYPQSKRLLDTAQTAGHCL